MEESLGVARTRLLACRISDSGHFDYSILSYLGHYPIVPLWGRSGDITQGIIGNSPIRCHHHIIGYRLSTTCTKPDAHTRLRNGLGLLAARDKSMAWYPMGVQTALGRMVSLLWSITAAVALQVASLVQGAPTTDPCVVVGGQKWVAPADLRACFK